MRAVITHIIGGLGNQMFQYATGLAAARRNNVSLRLDLTAFRSYRRPYTLGAFCVDAPSASNADYLLLSAWSAKRSPLRWFDERRPVMSRAVRHDPGGYRYEPELLDMGQRSRIYLIGHWQNEQYFQTVRGELLTAFRLRPEHTPATSSATESIAAPESVAIHIRRGDNIQKPDQKNPLKMIPQLGMVSQQYVSDAMQLVRSRVPDASFIIFSDEPDWVRKNMALPFPVVYLPSRTYSDVQEFELMRMCKHHIIANSTFSWWAAWLNDKPDKIVCAPKQWDERFPDYDTNGLIPASWNLV